MASKRKQDEEDNDESGKSSVPPHLRNQDKRLIVILEQANLETIKVGKKYELLNNEDHKFQMKKYKKESICRPDITHQCLLMLFDSPLNRAGLLQVYVHTERNVLIQLDCQTRIPRTFNRFSGLIVQLFHTLFVRAAAAGSQKLLKVIKNPVTRYLPVGCKKISTSFHSKKLVHPRELVPKDGPLAVVIGAMAHGQVNVDYTEDTVSFSQYPLSAALACSKLCCAFEDVWGIQ